MNDIVGILVVFVLPGVAVAVLVFLGWYEQHY
jgi:hypothetical protein